MPLLFKKNKWLVVDFSLYLIQILFFTKNNCLRKIYSHTSEFTEVVVRVSGPWADRGIPLVTIVTPTNGSPITQRLPFPVIDYINHIKIRYF